MDRVPHLCLDVASMSASVCTSPGGPAFLSARPSGKGGDHSIGANSGGADSDGADSRGASDHAKWMECGWTLCEHPIYTRLLHQIGQFISSGYSGGPASCATGADKGNTDVAGGQERTDPGVAVRNCRIGAPLHSTSPLIEPPMSGPPSHYT